MMGFSGHRVLGFRVGSGSTLQLLEPLLFGSVHFLVRSPHITPISPE